MCINYLVSFCKKHKTFLFIIAIITGLFVLGFDSAFAANDESGLDKEQSDKIIKILTGFITGAAALMGMITSFITMFLYPGWTNGTLFGLQDYLKIMWILVSNVVYFIFAFILIAIAFMNIIGKGEGIWELKQAMPRFIVGVLIVPFSWFFVQFLLSLSAVLTVGILTLPYDSFQDQDLFKKALSNKEFAGKEICKDVIIAFDQNFDDYNVKPLSSEETGLDENIKCLMDDGGGKITIEELITGSDKADGLQDSIFGVMSIYAYGILKIDELDTLNEVSLQSIKSITDLIFKVGFDIIFVAAYLLLMIALMLALFARGIRLWLYMMLCPVFGLLYFLDKGKEGIGETKFSIKEFVSLALVPVYVSGALAFGLVFIMVASQGIEEANDGSNTLEAGGFSLTITGAHGDVGDKKKEYQKSPLGRLVVEIFGVAILWIAVMAALNTSETTKAIVAPIQAFGKSVGDLAAKAPTYAPIIPTGNGERMSVTGLQQVGSSLSSKAEQSARGRGSDFMKRMGGDADSIDLSSKSTNILATHQANGNKMTREALDELKSAIKSGKSVQKLAQSPEFLATINHLMQEDEKFKNDADIKKLGTVSRGDFNTLGKALSQMDLIMDRDYQAIGGFMDDSVTGTSAGTADKVNKRLYNAAPSANPGNTTNTSSTTTANIDMKNNTIISRYQKGGDMKKISEEVSRLLGPNTMSRSDMEAKLAAVKISDSTDVDKIITALGNKIT